ncbi:restriction endonuclease, partial [Streptomyces sp. NPDC056480]|uniref:restriction endonuclease n=1 Tax=Streptomyces sp. NPDC056480 TaxID=3345833 RepID=UPI0036C9FEBE
MASRRTVVQCKRLSRPVDPPAVHQFNGTARPGYGADHAVHHPAGRRRGSRRSPPGWAPGS